MKKIISGIYFSFVFILLIFSCSRPVYAAESDKRVLFISSYSYAWETVPLQIDGILESLDSHTSIDYQFMDTKNINNGQFEMLFYERLKYYIQHQKPYDVIITGDDAAFHFAIKYEELLFPDIPIVFEGVENRQIIEQEEKNPLVCGVVETLSFADTIRLAQKIYPDASQVVAILDDTISGRGERNQYYNLEKDFPELEFQEINASKLTEAQLLHNVATLDDTSILLYVICSENADGETYPDLKIVPKICDTASVPVFSVVPLCVGKGFAGGAIPSHQEMGHIAGEMAEKILNGASPSSLGIQTTVPSKLYFDENVMRRFHIKKSQLPNDAEILNHTPGFLESAYVYFIIIFLIISVLLFIIYRLFVDVKKESLTNLRISETNRKLKLDSHYDALTSIYNRRALMEDIEKLITAKQPFGLIMYDLDDFKHINDYYGHNEGDSVLHEIAARSQKYCDSHCTSYRLGGDEFMVLVRSGDLQAIEKYARKFHKIFADPFQVASESLMLHCSMGAAMYPHDGDSVFTLLEAADSAMYMVKKSGKDNIIFSWDIC